MQFCVDSNHMSHWNLSDRSIAFTRWRHIASLLAQSLQPAVTRAATCGVQLRRWENQRRLLSYFLYSGFNKCKKITCNRGDTDNRFQSVEQCFHFKSVSNTVSYATATGAVNVANKLYVGCKFSGNLIFPEISRNVQEIFGNKTKSLEVITSIIFTRFR